MSIRVPFNGASLAKPGAYSRTTVNLSGGFPLAQTGIVAIVGEALGGALDQAMACKRLPVKTLLH